MGDHETGHHVMHDGRVLHMDDLSRVASSSHVPADASAYCIVMAAARRVVARTIAVGDGHALRDWWCAVPCRDSRGSRGGAAIEGGRPSHGEAS